MGKLKRPDIDAIIEREQAATDRPWNDYDSDFGPRIIGPKTAEGYPGIGHFFSAKNRAFVIHARDDVPDLTDYALTLETKIAKDQAAMKMIQASNEASFLMLKAVAESMVETKQEKDALDDE